MIDSYGNAAGITLGAIFGMLVAPVSGPAAMRGAGFWVGLFAAMAGVGVLLGAVKFAVLARERVELTAAGITVFGPFRTDFLPWPGIDSIVETRTWGARRLMLWSGYRTVKVRAPYQSVGPWSDAGFEDKARTIVEWWTAYRVA